MSGERERRARKVLLLKSEKNKVGVPADRRFLSPEQSSALADCIERGWLVWIDQERHPAFGWRDLDVFLVTPSGLAALEPEPTPMTDVDGLSRELVEWPGDGQELRERAAAALRQLQSDLTAAKAERDELRKALERAEDGARNLNSYLTWQLSPESPGYHPTFRSAVAHFRGCFAPEVFAPGASRFEAWQKARRLIERETR